MVVLRGFALCALRSAWSADLATVSRLWRGVEFVREGLVRFSSVRQAERLQIVLVIIKLRRCRGWAEVIFVILCDSNWVSMKLYSGTVDLYYGNGILFVRHAVLTRNIFKI